MIAGGKSALTRVLVQGNLIGIALLLSLGQTEAQGLRDPTVAPAEAGLAGAAPSAPALTAVPGAMTIIVRDGRPFLVVGTRLYAVGQKLGQARIERISETEVWLREGGFLRKLPQFTGIERRAQAPGPEVACNDRGAQETKATKASNSSRTSPLVAPCVGVPPRGLTP